MGKGQDICRMSESDENQLLFYGRRSHLHYQIFKLHLKRDFSAVKTGSPNFYLKRCSHGRRRRRRKRRSWNWMGRCNRHLVIGHKLRQFLNRMERAVKHSPKAFFEITCKPGQPSFPREFSVAALGSKLYIFGGYSWVGADKCYRYANCLPTDVYYIDAIADSGVMVNMSTQMNSGKRTPLAWTVGGKIYVLPSVFSFGEPPGHFECFDPKSESWTILPSPPFVDDESQFTVPSDGFLDTPPLLLVKNSILLGSNLVISTQAGTFYSFDTAQPRQRWRVVSLRFGSNEIKFLPFDPLSSVLVGDNLIYCYVDSHSFPPPFFGQPFFGQLVRGRGHAEKSFLKSLNIDFGDSYICRFEYDAQDVHRLHLCIKPVTGRGMGDMIEWGEYVNYRGSGVDVDGIGDGLVMFVKTGFFQYGLDSCSSLNVFRIQEEGDRYVASNISTALLRLSADSHFSSFIMKDGIFT